MLGSAFIPMNQKAEKSRTDKDPTRKPKKHTRERRTITMDNTHTRLEEKRDHNWLREKRKTHMYKR
jgi:hypothetical protein